MKKEPILQYIEDNKILFEKENATKAEVDAAHKRQERRDTWREFVASGGKELPKLSKEEIKKVQGDRKVRDYMLRNYRPKVATKPIEENLYEIYLQMLKAGELLPNMSFKEFEKNFNAMDVQVKRKKPTSPVEIDFSLDPMKTAYLGLGWGDAIKNSSLYKLLDNPRVLGVELGHESIIEIINLLNRTGLLKGGGKVK